MRIEQLTITNFKAFSERSFQFPRGIDATPEEGSFHVFIGENGSGKTSILDALSVALGFWHSALPGTGHRPISRNEIRLIAHQAGDTTRFDPAPFASVEIVGEIAAMPLRWKRSRSARSGLLRKANWDADAEEAVAQIERLTTSTDNMPLSTLPVIGYYGAGRAWLPSKPRLPHGKLDMKKQSRFDAYIDCLEGRINDSKLNEWVLWERLAFAELGRERLGYQAVKQAVLSCLPDGRDLHFDVDRKEMIVTLGEKAIPFYSLSDGQRAMASLVADLAIKTVLLNPQLGLRSALETPGVVLIDELDLHLHPKWQRHVVDDLRKAFPRVQFFTTTHSPFIIQTLRPGELIPLDGETVPEFGNLGIEAIARGLMGVERPDVGPRYQQMVEVAKDYLMKLEESDRTPTEKLATYQEALANRLAPFADNPAFQAFLELKREAKLGSRSTPEAHHNITTGSAEI